MADDKMQSWWSCNDQMTMKRVDKMFKFMLACVQVQLVFFTME